MPGTRRSDQDSALAAHPHDPVNSRLANPVCALLSTMAACGSAPSPEPATDWNWRTETTDAEQASLPSANLLMQDIDAPRIDAPLTKGDAALFGLHLLHGGETRSWFVRITALENEAATDDGLALAIEVFDGQTRPIATETVTVTRNLIGGVTRACTAPNRADATSPPDPPRHAIVSLSQSHNARALFTVMDVLRIVENTDALADILWQAVRRPPVLSLLGGVNVSAGMSFEHARPTIDPATGTPAFEFPLRINVNKVPGLLCTVTAVEPAPPLRVCGGITRLVGHDPEDRTRRVVLRLLAAHCAR
jgi:hypothetical protein